MEAPRRKSMGFLKAGLERCFNVVGKGDAFIAAATSARERRRLLRRKVRGFGSWFLNVSGFGLLSGFHVAPPQEDCITKCMQYNTGQELFHQGKQPSRCR